MDVQVSSPMSTEAQKFRARRDINADFIRAAAVIMVVLLHISSPPVSAFNETPRAGWWVANAIDAFTRPCVPLFLLLSGYFLLDPTREETLGAFYRKRVRKVLIPFLAWSVIFLGWNVRMMGQSYTLGAALQAILEGRVYFHLWYVYTLLGLYLATPILRDYVRGSSRHGRLYFVGLWIVATSLVPVLNRLLGFDLGINFVVTTGFVGYFAAGELLRDVRLPVHRLWLPAGLYLLGWVVTMFGNFWITASQDGKLDQFFFLYTSPAIVLMSLSGFVLLNSLPLARLLSAHWRIRSVITGLSAMSLGIYLIHVILLDGLRLNYLSTEALASPLTTALIMVLGALVVLILSYMAVLVLRRLPLARSIVP